MHPPCSTLNVIPAKAGTQFTSQRERRWHNLIAKLRSLRMTALEISETLSFPRSTIAHHLKTIGLSRLNRLTPPEPVRRYERKRPGDLIHLDIKKLRRFNRLGHRFAPRQACKQSPSLGYECVHVAIDDHSRVAYVEILPDEKGETCADFLARATK